MIVVKTFQIDNLDSFRLEIPKSAKVLGGKEANGQLFINVLVNTNEKSESRHFQFYETNQEIQADFINALDYIGTYLTEKTFVHMFEVLDFKQVLAKHLSIF